MKKQILYVLLTTLLCFAMALSFAACDRGGETTATADDGTTAAPVGDGSSMPAGDGTSAPEGDGTSAPAGDGASTPDDGGSNPSHTHSYAAAWSSNETHHWHAATCEHRDEKKDYAAHAWDAGTVTTPATCGKVGVKKYTCECGKIKTEEIPQLTTHTYSAGWSVNETHHWHAAICGHRDEKADYAAHAWDEGVITTPATCGNVGVMTYTCSTCGKTKTEEIPRLEHPCTTEWSEDASHHWHAATCEHSDARVNYAGHTYGADHICTVCGRQVDPTVGVQYTLNNDRNAYGVSGIGSATDTDIVIAATYEGLPVTRINYTAFADCESLTSITIPDSVTSIGYSAFNGCTSVTSITIPGSVKSIDYRAFYRCSSLTDVHIPDIAAWCNILFVDSYANPIYYAHNLYLNGVLVTDLVIPESVTSIGDYVFEGCSSLTSIAIPDSVTSIGDLAFNDCRSLASITIPDSVTSIGYSAFNGCTNLIQIVDGVSYVDKWVIDCNTSVTSVELRSDTLGIGSSAFSCCDSLTSITIPDSVTSIGDEAFYGCAGLIQIVDGVSYVDKWVIDYDSSVTSVELRSDTVGIGDDAFWNCTSLASITIPGSVTSIGDEAFWNCASLTNVYYTGTVEEWNAISISSSDNSDLTSATRYYYSETTPTDTDNLYWHYVSGVPTPW